MDKYEFNIKVEQIKKLVNKNDFATAMKIADTIDWRRVRNANLLSMISQVYEKNREYQEAKEVLLLAFERAPIGKRLLYKLTELALREGSIGEAEDYYREFCDLAPDDTRQHLLRYMLLKEKKAPVDQIIHSLERYTSTEMDEKWMYELAELYARAGRTGDCIQLCDKMILLFGVGAYVERAMELKQRYAPLTNYQKDLIQNRDKYEEKLRAVEEGYENGTIRIQDYQEPGSTGFGAQGGGAGMYGSSYMPGALADAGQGYAANGGYGSQSQEGYMAEDGGYSQPQDGYMASDSGYGQSQGGYTAGGPGYGQPQNGYMADDGGYSQPQSGYMADDGGYGQSQSGYMAGNAGYGQPQSGYMAGDGGYGQPQSGYMAGDSGYGQSQEDYMAGNAGYGQPQSSYMAGDGGYGQPQEGYMAEDSSYVPSQGAYMTKNTPQGGYMAGDGGYGQSRGYMDGNDGYGQPQEEYIAEEGGEVPSQGDYMAGSAGYGQRQGGYAAANGGYGQPQDGYMAGNGDYSQSQGGYAAANRGGYSQPQGGYMAGNEGYVQSQEDYMAGNAGYQPQDGYIAGNEGYGRPQEGYTAGGAGYSQPEDSYMAGNGGYGQPYGGYMAENGNYVPPQGDYIAGNGGYSQPRGGYMAPNNGYDQSQGGYMTDDSEYGQPRSGYRAERENYGHPSGHYLEENGAYGSAQDGSYTEESGYSQGNSGYMYGDDEELMANLHQAAAEKELAAEMSRISNEGHIEQEPQSGRTKVFRDRNGIAAARRAAEREREKEKEYHDKVYTPHHLMIEAKTPETGFETAVEVLKKIHEKTGVSNQVIKISGSRLSRRGIFNVSDKLAGKDLIVEEAGDLRQEDLEELQMLLERDETGMIVVLIDNPFQMKELHQQNPGFINLFQCIDADEQDSDVSEVPEEAWSQAETEEEPEDMAKEPVAEQEPEEEDDPLPEQEDRETDAGMDEGEEDLADPSDDEIYEEYEDDPYEEDFSDEDIYPDEEDYADENHEEAEYEEGGGYEDEYGDGDEYDDEYEDEYEAEDEYDEDEYDDDQEYEDEYEDGGEFPEPGDDEELELNDFADYAVQYAKDIDCSITGKSMLALYERIELMEEDGIPLTRTNAEDLIEEAADKAEKPSLGGLIKGVFSSKYDKDGLLILKEEHFI